MPEVLTYQCPFCDREVRVGDPCPGCTAKEKKKRPAAKPAMRPEPQDPIYDGLDLPDEEFDYHEFVAREFGPKPHRKLRVKWYWWALGLVALAAWVVTRVLG